MGVIVAIVVGIGGVVDVDADFVVVLPIVVVVAVVLEFS